MDWIVQPWPWYVSGPLLAVVMFLLLFSGGSFGVSANLRIFCAACGGDYCSDFFCFNWKSQLWNLIFVAGMILGGYLAHQYLTPDQSVAISDDVKVELMEYGLDTPGASYMPEELFSWKALSSWKGILMLVLGGFLVGFGARYAGGCTSGHAISGLSNLQLPSLIAVIGFFIGGLVMVYFILPSILSLP